MELDLNDQPENEEGVSTSVDEPLREEEELQSTTFSPFDVSSSWPPKPTPTKSTLKALPTVRDHTTDQLGPAGDEYLPREIDESGEKKVMPNGALNGGREYRCRTFQIPNRGTKLFMLATECARALGYRDSYLLFNKNRSLFKIVANQTEKDDLVSQEILPSSYRSRQIAIITARSIFRQFGSRVIVNGRKVRDDYWELKAHKQGFTEADLAGKKRPGTSRAREASAAAAQKASLLGHRQAEIAKTTPLSLYLQHRQPGVAARNPGLGASEISEIIEDLWHGEKKEVRTHWEGAAEEDRAQLDQLFLPHETKPRRAEATGLVPTHPGLNQATSSKGSYIPPWLRTDDQTVNLYPSREQSPKISLETPKSILRAPSTRPRGRGQVHIIENWTSAESTEERLYLLDRLANRPIHLPKVAGVGSTWQGWLRCEWELPEVVLQLRKSESSNVKKMLATFVTITGSRNGIECSTCVQFLEKTWKESGEMALDVLSMGVSTMKQGSESSSVSFRGVEIHAAYDYIVLEVGADQRDAQAFIDAVVWVCAAVRVNPERQPADAGERSQLQLSKASQLGFSKSAGLQALVYGLDELIECSDQDLDPQAKCWTRLFRSGIVAFHPLERQWGAGLEIPFDMLLDLSGVENVYQIEGGIILAGFFTALVPVSRDEATNSVQWHFEEVDRSSGELLRPFSLPSVRGDWYKSQDLDMFRTSKCFVGWFARANILLGTRQLVVNSGKRLNWSTETKEHRQSARREGFEAGGQLGFTAGPINTGLQLISTWRFHSNVQHFHRHEQYSTALRLGRGNVAVIIDSESKQVWLVPLLSLVLHLCHRYFQEVNCSGQADSPLPFADPSPDGAAEAARVLESSGDVLVFGAAGEPDAENLRQLFLRINTNLLNASGTREQSNKKKLFASELMAMVTEPGRGSRLKEIKAPADAETWVGLLERVDFVGVCANIGHLIEPDLPSMNTCSCSALPCNRYFLAAHMRCLDALSQREGHSMKTSLNRVCRLGERVFWNMERLYWTACPSGCHDPIWDEKEKILQQISSKEKGKGKNVAGLNGQTALHQHLPEDGVVVFGGDTTKRGLQGFRWNEYV